MHKRRAHPAPRALRCAFLLVPVVLCAAFALLAADATISSHGVVSLLYVAATTLNVTLLALSAMSGILGMVAVAFARGRRAGPRQASPTGRARTALVMPVYEEDPVRVFAAVSAMCRSLAAETLGHVEFHVLSDTQSREGAACEQAVYSHFMEGQEGAGIAVHYRRRPANQGRKTGNIADFCRTSGTSYDFMIVLDADSLMTGASISRLVGAMEANPRAGIIQAMVYPVGCTSLFARVQQFGARLYGPMLARGVELWQGAHGSYWGHNAIIRIEPFLAHCSLPVLSGPAPMGGEILCHDTVEAAFMLRAGWDVWMLPGETQSFEQTPTNLMDHLVRDRRWCQGNLQHVRLLRTPGLRTASILHLAMGISHYLSAPLLVLFIALSTQMDDGWSDSSHARLLREAIVSMVVFLMFAPKVASLLHALASSRRSSAFGGRARLLAAALLEQVFGLLAGPVCIVFYTVFVADAVMGRVVGWDAQSRSERGLGMREVSKGLGTPLIVASLCAALAAGTGAGWTCWLLLPGLVLAVPLAVFTGSAAVGTWVRSRGLFLTPYETDPPAEFALLSQAQARLESASPSWTESPAARNPAASVPDGVLAGEFGPGILGQAEGMLAA